MMTFPIPVVAHRPQIGPGSQPVDDEVLVTLDVPNDVHAYRPPQSELDAPPEVAGPALDFLRELLAALRESESLLTQPRRFSLLGYPPAVRAEINELLGEGEVAVMSAAGLRAQETAFTGIWRVRGEGIDDVEASAFPLALRELAMARTLPPEAAAPPPGLMNAPALYHEIRSLSGIWRAGKPARVINLSLLPATPDDLAWLDEELGRISFSVLSRGFGNCRITATAHPYVWWVQYFNNMEKLILNSIEIVDMPAVALAAAEDHEATVVRLDEWIASIESAREN
jgi:hydrogenase-1 operon protein HyaF